MSKQPYNAYGRRGNVWLVVLLIGLLLLGCLAIAVGGLFVFLIIAKSGSSQQAMLRVFDKNLDSYGYFDIRLDKAGPRFNLLVRKLLKTSMDVQGVSEQEKEEYLKRLMRYISDIGGFMIKRPDDEERVTVFVKLKLGLFSFSSAPLLKSLLRLSPDVSSMDDLSFQYESSFGKRFTFSYVKVTYNDGSVLYMWPLNELVLFSPSKDDLKAFMALYAEKANEPLDDEVKTMLRRLSSDAVLHFFMVSNSGVEAPVDRLKDTGVMIPDRIALWVNGFDSPEGLTLKLKHNVLISKDKFPFRPVSLDESWYSVFEDNLLYLKLKLNPVVLNGYLLEMDVDLDGLARTMSAQLGMNVTKADIDEFLGSELTLNAGFLKTTPTRRKLTFYLGLIGDEHVLRSLAPTLMEVGFLEPYSGGVARSVIGEPDVYRINGRNLNFDGDILLGLSDNSLSALWFVDLYGDANSLGKLSKREDDDLKYLLGKLNSVQEGKPVLSLTVYVDGLLTLIDELGREDVYPGSNELSQLDEIKAYKESLEVLLGDFSSISLVLVDDFSFRAYLKYR